MKRVLAIICVVMVMFGSIIGVSAEEAESDWVIDGDVLVEYKGREKIVTVPDGIREIGKRAFYKNTAIQQVILPEGVEAIDHSAFAECQMLKWINIPEGVCRIGHQAFRECTHLEEIKLPKSLTEIGSASFLRCYKIKEVTIPGGVSVIGSGAFEYCASLETLVISEGVTKIEARAFSDCGKLKNLTLPQSLAEIEYNVFTGCKSLDVVVIPDNVETVPMDAFSRCGDITLYVPPGVKSLNWVKESLNGTNPEIYARPESVIYGKVIKRGFGHKLHDAYLPKVGDVVDEIIDSDIYVTMNGQLIPSYCVDGRTLILIRDLERYGFDVRFDAENKIAYADFNADKSPYDGITVQLGNRNVLYTDIRAIVNGVEVEVRNTNGFVAVEAERLGNYVPEISCVWQMEHRRLQMLVFEGMASFEDLVNSISDRKGIPYTEGCSYYADSDNGRYVEFTNRGYLSAANYNGYIRPMRGLTMQDFVLVAGRVYYKKIDAAVDEIRTEVPSYLKGYVEFMQKKGILVPDENGEIYLDGILTREQMEYYLDILDREV